MEQQQKPVSFIVSMDRSSWRCIISISDLDSHEDDFYHIN